MKGKILGLGAISGDDGKRYSFELSDIANLGQRKVQDLAGCEVDFVPSQDSAATAIFIIDNAFHTSINENPSKPAMDNTTRSIRFKFLLSTWLFFIAFLFVEVVSLANATRDSSLHPVIYFSFTIMVICMTIGFIFFILALIGISRASESRSLIKNLVVFSIATIIEVGISVIIGLIVSPMTGLILFIIFIIAIIFYLQYARELAFITNQKLLLWAAYLSVLAGLGNQGAGFTPISDILVFISIIMQIVGFVKFREIRKRSENDVMPWF